MKIHFLILFTVIAPMLTFAEDEVALQSGVDFTYQGKDYESRLSRQALLTSPSWSPLQPLPLNQSNAVQIAQAQVAAFASDPKSWMISEIQLICLNHAAKTQRWFYVIRFKAAQRPASAQTLEAARLLPPLEEIVICIDFAGRPGVIRPKEGA
jgi:hypothetical protein